MCVSVCGMDVREDEDVVIGQNVCGVCVCVCVCVCMVCVCVCVCVGVGVYITCT